MLAFHPGTRAVRDTYLRLLQRQACLDAVRLSAPWHRDFRRELERLGYPRGGEDLTIVLPDDVAHGVAS